MKWHASSTNPSLCTSLQRFANAPFFIGAVSEIEHFQRPGHRLSSRVLLGDLPNTSLSRQLSIIAHLYQHCPHAGRHLLLNRPIVIGSDDGPDRRWVRYPFWSPWRRSVPIHTRAQRICWSAVYEYLVSSSPISQFPSAAGYSSIANRQPNFVVCAWSKLCFDTVKI